MLLTFVVIHSPFRLLAVFSEVGAGGCHRFTQVP
jgi:hypothetical protein